MGTGHHPDARQGLSTPPPFPASSLSLLPFLFLFLNGGIAARTGLRQLPRSRRHPLSRSPWVSPPPGRSCPALGSRPLPAPSSPEPLLAGPCCHPAGVRKVVFPVSFPCFSLTPSEGGSEKAYVLIHVPVQIPIQ